MANYNITKSDGTAITVANGDIDNKFSLTLLGQNAVGYGQHVAQNTVRHLENFYGDTAPAGALRGQTWYHADPEGVDEVGIMKAWTGEDPSDPGFNVLVDDSALLANLGKWVVIGPENINAGQIGTNVDPYTNIYVTNVYSDNGSYEEVFVGITPNGTTINNTGFIPVPDSTADNIGVKFGLSTNRFRESHIRNEFVYGSLNIGTFTTNRNVKLIADPTVDYTLIPDAAQLVNLGNAASTVKRFNSVNATTTDTTILRVGTSASQGLATDLVPTTDNTYDLGAVGRYYNQSYVNDSTVQNLYAKSTTAEVGTAVVPFQNMYATTFNGTATQALYADLAERFAADAVYYYGTVIKIGGTHEITETTGANDPEVFGVISKNPAYMMNAAAGDGNNDTHPYVAWSGRVDVRVVGPVRKGQRLVSSHINGVAMGANGGDDWRCVFGRALEDKTSEGQGMILVAVGAK